MNSYMKISVIFPLLFALATAVPFNLVPLYGLSEQQHRLIFQLTSLFENSTPDLQYGYIQDISDGRGYTLGYVGFCTGTGDGYEFIKDYYLARAKDSPIKKYLPELKKLAESESDSHTGLDGFEKMVKSLKDSYDWKKAMDRAVDHMYFRPAMKMAMELGLTKALSRGQLYDAFINHGASGAIEIIKKTEKKLGGTPASGMDESKWLRVFLIERKKVLAADSTWAEAVDRVNVYQQLLQSGDLSLKHKHTLNVYGDRYEIVLRKGFKVTSGGGSAKPAYK